MATPHRIKAAPALPSKPKLPKLKAFKLVVQIPTEHQTQAAFISWLRVYKKHHPELALGFAVPNGGARNIKTAATLKAEGVTAGVPDYMLPLPRGNYMGLAIEFKREKTGHVTDHQREYMALLADSGRWRVEIHTDWTRAKEAVLTYLSMPVPRLL